MEVHSFNFSPPSDDDLPEVLTAEMLAPPPDADPSDGPAFSLSLNAKFKFAFMLRKLEFPVADFVDCVRTLIGVELTAAGLANAGKGKWRVGDDVRGAYSRSGFAIGITGRVSIDHLVEEFAAVDRKLAFAAERMTRVFEPYRDLVGKDDARARDKLDRFLVEHGHLWHDLRRVGCAVVKLLADNIASLTGDDMPARTRHALAMRHASETDGNRSLRNALIMLAVIANDLRRQHWSNIAEATWEWEEGIREFVGRRIDMARDQCDEAADAFVEIEDFPDILEAAINAAGRSMGQNPGLE